MDDTTQKILGTVINKLFEAALKSKAGIVTTAILIILGLVLSVAGAWLSSRLRRRALEQHKRNVAEAKKRLLKDEEKVKESAEKIKALDEEIKRRDEKIKKLDKQIESLRDYLSKNRPSWI